MTYTESKTHSLSSASYEAPVVRCVTLNTKRCFLDMSLDIKYGGFDEETEEELD